MRVAALSLAVLIAAVAPLAAQPVLLAPPPPPGASLAEQPDPAPRAARVTPPEAQEPAESPERGGDLSEDSRMEEETDASPNQGLAGAPVEPPDAEREDVWIRSAPTEKVIEEEVTHTSLAPRAGTTAAAAPSQIAAAEGPTLLSLTVEREVRAAPDQATITIGVVNEAPSARQAAVENARSMTQLMQSLRRAGVAERDVQTAQLRLEPQRLYQEGAPPRITGYQAINTVQVLVRNLPDLGPTLDAAAEAGANQIEGVTFGFSDPDPILNDARREAVRRARERAELYADAAGMRLSRVVSIQEGYAHPPPMPMARMEVQAAAAGVPVSPGETTLIAAVTMTFALQ